MKTKKCGLVSRIIILALGLGLLAPAARAQTNGAGFTPAQIAANQALLQAADAPDQPSGPNHRTTLRHTPAGTHKIVELTTGMNVFDGETWVPSEPGFAADTNGFFAGKTQHQVYLAADIATTNAVTVITPEGIELESTPVAIALYDAASGNFSVIASVTNSLGERLSTNQIIYPDCFSAGVCADIVYTITESSFHQDVVFTGALDPAAYGFPEATTRIQIITALASVANPEVATNVVYTETDSRTRQSMASPDLLDEELGFGHFVMTRGKAYVAPSEEITNGVEAPVGKEFITAGGARYLVESVRYASIATALAALPPCHPTVGQAQVKTGKLYASLPHPRLGSAPTARHPERSAQAGLNSSFKIHPSSFPPRVSAPVPGAVADARVRHREHGVVVD